MDNRVCDKSSDSLYYLAVGVLVVAVSLTYLFRPIYDPDFFWHLKTGEWIWQHRMLPAFDPFSHTITAAATPQQIYLLSSYWLSQILFYLSWVALDGWGVYLLRLLMVVSLVLLMVKRRGDDPVVSLSGIILLLVCLLEVYPLERPQLFSFLFFPFLIRLLKRASEANSRSLAVTPIILIAVLMLAWTNIHGAVVVGQALLALYLLKEIMTPVLPGNLRGTMNKTLLIGALAGLVASLVNPNMGSGIVVASRLLKPGNDHYHASTTEYMSSLSVLESGDYTVILTWVITGLFLLAVMMRIRQQHPAFSAVALLISYYAMVQVRYIPLLLVMAIPTIIEFFSSLASKAIVRGLFLVLAAGSLFYFAGNEWGNIGKIKRDGWISESYFPVQAADYVVKNNIRGKMFNTYLWGGYLLWRLGPERKVFVDGRGMDPKVFWDMAAIETSAAWGSSEKPLWKTMFEKYGINYAIVPKRDEFGEPYLLAAAIARDTEWKVAFQSFNSMVLVKN